MSDKTEQITGAKLTIVYFFADRSLTLILPNYIYYINLTVENTNAYIYSQINGYIV